MGLVYAEIEIINGADLILHENGYIEQSAIRRQQIKALVDSGAYMLTLPEHLVNQLGLRKMGKQEAELADGTVKLLDVVGPVDIQFENRSTTVRAMVIPTGDALLGSIPMEDMDVILHPKEQKLVVNPENPYIPKKSLK